MQPVSDLPELHLRRISVKAPSSKDLEVPEAFKAWRMWERVHHVDRPPTHCFDHTAWSVISRAFYTLKNQYSTEVLYDHPGLAYLLKRLMTEVGWGAHNFVEVAVVVKFLGPPALFSNAKEGARWAFGKTKEERFFSPLIKTSFVEAVFDAIMAMNCWHHVGENLRVTRDAAHHQAEKDRKREEQEEAMKRRKLESAQCVHRAKPPGDRIASSAGVVQPPKVVPPPEVQAELEELFAGLADDTVPNWVKEGPPGIPPHTKCRRCGELGHRDLDRAYCRQCPTEFAQMTEAMKKKRAKGAFGRK